MQLSLSENAVDLLGELLQKERDAMDNTDPNDEECFFSQEEYDSRIAALDELQGMLCLYTHEAKQNKEKDDD